MFSGATGDPLSAWERSAPFLSLRFGFLDEPDVPAALRYAAERGLIEGDLADVAAGGATYFLSTITIDPTEDPGMAR